MATRVDVSGKVQVSKMGHDAPGERASWSDRLRLLTVVLLGVALTLLAAGSLRQAEQLRLREYRRAATDRVVQAFEQELTRILEALRTAALMLEVHPALTREQFNSYMRKLVEGQLSINVVEWQPIVAARELEAFQAEARRSGFPDFAAIEPDGSGKGWRLVAGRDPYVVVRYAWPEQYQTVGYDMSFSPERMASKLQAAVTGVPTASSPFEFMKEGKMHSGSMAVAISAAVFGPDRQARGYLAAVVDLPTLFQRSSERAREARLDLQVSPTAPVDSAPFFSGPAVATTPALAPLTELERQQLSATLAVAGQQWRVQLRPAAGFYDDVQPQLSLWLLAAGGLMTLLLARAVMLVQASRRRTEGAERAAQCANEALRIQSERLLEAQRIAHLGSWQVDLQTSMISWSPEVCALLGLPPDAADRPLNEQRAHFSADSWDRFEAALRAAAEGSEAFELELACTQPDGRRSWLLARGAARVAAGALAPQIHGVAMDISARKQAELEIESLAFTDTLTALPNRRLLIDRLAHALAFSERHERFGAMLFVDLDGFKKINDTFGHQRGDLLLRQVAQRLTAAMRKGDTVGRLGGDEFLVLLEDIGSSAPEAAAHAGIAANKLLDILRAPYVLGADQHSCTASIGVAVFGAERQQPEELLRRADLAMYRAKAAGRNAVCFFDPSMQEAILARAQRENELREALRSNGLRLHYQPQADASGRITGVEALLRLQLPDRGLVIPKKFTALAEETGLIVPLDAWVLQTAVAQLAAWSLRPERRDLGISVNVSPRQFRSAGFLPGLEALLAASPIAPQRLTLELTEGVLLDDLDDAAAKMQRIAALGVRLSLDDFGTGFSSLAYLKRLPLAEVKIDRSFVEDLVASADDRAIAQMIIVLGDSLGLDVLAEGVEQAAQRDLLLSLGCQHFQGYLFGRPMEVDALESMLDGQEFDARGFTRGDRSHTL